MESKSLPREKLADLETSRYIANVSLLTILRTWCGIFIFSGDMNGLNSYLNILATHGEEEPELAKQMLCVLFTLIGVAPPSYLEELAHHHTSSVYWNGCSLFIHSINKKIASKQLVQTNLLTTYLSIIVWSLINSKLPEILSSLTVSSNPEVSFLAEAFLRNLSFLAAVFDCLTKNIIQKTVQEVVLTFQSEKSLKDDELTQAAKARDCFRGIGNTALYLYPILETETFHSNRMSDLFGYYTLFECILDCFCSLDKDSEVVPITDYLCKQDIPFERFVGKSLCYGGMNNNTVPSFIKAVIVFTAVGSDM